MRAVAPFPKLLLFLLMTLPALAFICLRSLALVRHGKAAQLARAFGLASAAVPLRILSQLTFRPKLTGMLEGRRVEVTESRGYDGQRPVTSTVFRLEVEPTLSKRLSARRKQLGRSMLAMVGASPATASLDIPLLDAKLEVIAFSPSDRECLSHPGVQNALLQLLSPSSDLRFEDGALRVTWPGAFSEPRWRQLLTTAAQLVRALDKAGASLKSELAG